MSAQHANSVLESHAPEHPKRCGSRTASGEPCRAPATQPDAKCWSHSALVADEDRARARARGGANTARVVQLDRRIREIPDLAGVYHELLAALVGVLDGSLPPPRASAAASVARALAELRRTAELEERLAVLEERAA